MKNITGQKFNRLTAIRFIERTNKLTYWLFRCDCGKETILLMGNVLRNNTKSCGCLNRSSRSKTHRIHGLSRSKFARAYHHAKARCENLNDFRFSLYGGRGIEILWPDLLTFKADMYESFLEHLELFGSNNTTLDRIDTNGHYCKENCRWATWKEQQNNKRNNVEVLTKA